MIYMFLADGFEETEALATLDVLRRAEIEVKTVGVTGCTVIGSHGISVFADLGIDEISVSDVSGVVLPGGMPGTTNLEKNDTVIECVKYAANNNLLVAAICAAPLILGHLGILVGKKATCFPGFESELKGAEIIEFGVVGDANVITAKGAGVSLEFGFKIVEFIKDKGLADNLRKTMQCI